ncbi:hypothetical protein B0H13DRAFT_1858341 [Mycena leptocephala]|nr:hypothetical protein B0H13DRAFT_1858341 [Mycena leptocephala]
MAWTVNQLRHSRKPWLGSVQETGLGRNLFHHFSFAHHAAAGRNGLALFTHAPISELVYLLSGASIAWQSGAEESPLPCRNPQNHGGFGGARRLIRYNEDDYEQPVEGSKKRWPKPPRGGVKRQKVAGAAEKPKRKKNFDSVSTTAPKAAVKRVRGHKKNRGPKKGGGK